MKVAAIVILYHPGQEVMANIKSYSDHFSNLYIFDNTPEASFIKHKMEQIKGVKFFHDGQNQGISERLNSGCKKALEDGYNWVLTMDQDTSFAPGVIVNYLNCFNNYGNKEQLAVIGTIYTREQQPLNAVCFAEDAEDVITSGMLLNLPIWNRIGGFDEALFIDLIDHEYCIRAAMNGFKIIRFANIHILHNIGMQVYRSSIKSLYIIKKKKEIHSPLRCYYMYRNMLYLENKYKKTNPAFGQKLRKYVGTHIKICRHYGRERKILARYIDIAKKDYVNNCMGKIEDQKII